jgi:Protein of unknown function with HXXEE motif
MTRLQLTFACLVIAQAAHSVEEYRGRLWETFSPARFVSGLVSRDLQQGFLFLNVALVAFGVWCTLWPVRRRWATAPAFAWLWVAIELVNGIVHSIRSLISHGYTPGVATAPVLLAVALYLALQLRDARVSAIV